MINISVAYASLERQMEIPFSVEESCTLAMAIRRSGILNFFPEIRLGENKVGVFGKLKSLDGLLKNDDRIEIYRPLLIDPKQARRQRAL